MDHPDWTAIFAADDGVRLQTRASDGDLTACEVELGSPLPSTLRAMYLTSDGVWDEPGQWFVIWPLADVAERNGLAYEREGPARRRWVAFGDDGTGNPFCVDRLGGSAVHYWSLIDQAATLLAGDMASFWAAWVAGSLPAH